MNQMNSRSRFLCLMVLKFRRKYRVIIFAGFFRWIQLSLDECIRLLLYLIFGLKWRSFMWLKYNWYWNKFDEINFVNLSLEQKNALHATRYFLISSDKKMIMSYRRYHRDFIQKCSKDLQLVVMVIVFLVLIVSLNLLKTESIKGLGEKQERAGIGRYHLHILTV